MSIELSEQEQLRRQSLAALRELGIDPYPAARYEVTATAREIAENFDPAKNNFQGIRIAGRIMSRRIMGSASFFELQDHTGRIQVYIRRDDICPEGDPTLYNTVFKKLLDIGDIVGVEGFAFRTNTGELSVHCQKLTLLSKSLRPLPVVKEKDGQTFDAFTDPEIRYRQRYVDLIVNLSCSPWTLNKERSRDKRVRQHAASAQGAFVPLVYVNACGMQNNGKNVMVFDGDSTIYDEQGERQLSLNDQFEPECRIVGLHEREVLTRQPETKLMRALVSAIREFDKQMFSPKMKWIVGLSGGLDSSITSALLVYALGAQRVVGYNMASRYNSLTTKNNAKALAERLGILIREGSIEKIVDATVDTLQDYGYPQAEGLALENIQARLRGHLLSSFASMEGGVIVNNGNKVEAALGYCTLYGDAIGALSPIADCTKVQLFDLAKQINAAFGREIIPANLLPEMDGDRLIWEFPPSAELKDDQRDPMKWFYHDWLINQLTEYPGGRVEEIMDDYLQGRLQTSEIGRWLRYYGLDEPQAFVQDLEWVLRTMQGAVFKRIQFPPLILISRGAFGSDVREAQMCPETTKRYRLLREQILALPKPC